MRRASAVVLGLALVLGSVRASALHVHVYAGHDHPEHHHGLAAHVHQQDGLDHDHDPGPRFEPCDPASHSVPWIPACVPAPETLEADVARAPVTVEPAPATTPGTRDLADVRVHGPPAGPRSSPRAPPTPLLPDPGR